MAELIACSIFLLGSATAFDMFHSATETTENGFFVDMIPRSSQQNINTAALLYTRDFHSGNACIKINYYPYGNDSAIICWPPFNHSGYFLYNKCLQSSKYNMLSECSRLSTYNLTGVREITFWVKGERGGELSEFNIGAYSDSIGEPITTGILVLAKEWQKYIIDLNGRNLSYVPQGFCWKTSKTQNPAGCTIYIDDIQFN